MVEEVINIDLVAAVVGLVGILHSLGDLGSAGHELVDIGLVGELALGGELLDLLSALRLPVLNVGVLADTEGAAGEDEGADGVGEAGSADSLLVGLGGTGLLGEDEAGTNPDGGSAHHEGGGEKGTAVDTTGSDNENLLLGEGRDGTLAGLNDGGDENSGGDVTGVTTTLTTLSADDIDTEVEALLDVLGVADHVHVDDAVGVELVDDVLGGNTDGGDEELGTGLDDDVDELVELALGVIVAARGEPWLAVVRQEMRL